MTKSSIHIEPVTNGSENHNERRKDFDYVRGDLTPKNESWTQAKVSDIRKQIETKYLMNVGQKMQAKSTPIREGVVNIENHHTITDLKFLALKIKASFAIETFQIHIHRDEGRWVDPANDQTIETKPIEVRPTANAIWKPNSHAHMVFNWTDATGKSIKLNKKEMSEFQTLVAKELKMERGKSSDRKHLDAIGYKIQQRSLELDKELRKAVDQILIMEKGLLGNEKLNIEATRKAIENQKILLLKMREQLGNAQNSISLLTELRKQSQGNSKELEFRLNELKKTVSEACTAFVLGDAKAFERAFSQQIKSEFSYLQKQHGKTRNGIS